MANETLTHAMEAPPAGPSPGMDATLVPTASVREAQKVNPFDTPAPVLPVAVPGQTFRPVTVFPREGMDLQPGAKPTERYAHQRVLGVGGYGEVDLVRDNDIDRLVARKRLKPELLYPEAVGRFAREVRIVGQLEHPGIVPVHDVGMDENGYFFLMKFVEGETLEDIINRLKTADPDTDRKYTYEYRTQIFMQVLRTIQFAHERGIVHRDIKPANVMVGRHGEVLVVDWGIAKQPGKGDPAVPEPATDAARVFPTNTRETVDGWLMGTPAYMSPEQARGENSQIDARSDVYALCALFYEFITLDHYLPRKETTEALLQAICTEEPMGAVAVHHRYGAPPELTFAIRKGLAKDPAERYQSVAELLARLQAVVDGYGPVMCPCTGIKRGGGAYSRFLNRRPIIAVTVAVFSAAFALVGVVDVGLWVAGHLR